MGAVCTCFSSIQKFSLNSSEYILKSDNNENDNIKNSQLKDKNKVESNKKISNNIPINNNNSPINNKVEEKIISAKNNTNLNTCSENSKKNNNKLINDSYNENSTKINDNKKLNEIQEKLVANENVIGEKDEENYDDNNKGEQNINLNNNKPDKLEPGTPKLDIKREDISSLNKGSKKVFSHFCKI